MTLYDPLTEYMTYGMLMASLQQCTEQDVHMAATINQNGSSGFIKALYQWNTVDDRNVVEKSS